MDLNDLRDPYLERLLGLLRDAALEVREANAQPLNIDTCQCLACQACAEPNPRGECENLRAGCDCMVDPDQPSANRSRT